jgi:hypothetical protein
LQVFVSGGVATERRYSSTHLPSPRREISRRRHDLALGSFGPGTKVLSMRSPELPVGAVVSMDPEAGPDRDSGYLVIAGSLTHRLRIGCNTFGRERDNDVVVADERLHVSRRHCSIVVHTDGSAEIFDLASLNGTFLNGARLVDRAPLRSHDVVRLGGEHAFSIVLYNPMGN